MLPYAEDASARAAAERLRAAVHAKPFDTSAGALPITFAVISRVRPEQMYRFGQTCPVKAIATAARLGMQSPADQLQPQRGVRTGDLHPPDAGRGEHVRAAPEPAIV